MQSALFGQQKVRPSAQVIKWEPFGHDFAAAVGVVRTEAIPKIAEATSKVTKSLLRMSLPPVNLRQNDPSPILLPRGKLRPQGTRQGAQRFRAAFGTKCLFGISASGTAACSVRPVASSQPWLRVSPSGARGSTGSTRSTRPQAHGVTNVYRVSKDLFLAQRFARHASPLTTTAYTHPGDQETAARVRTLTC